MKIDMTLLASVYNDVNNVLVMIDEYISDLEFPTVIKYDMDPLHKWVCVFAMVFSKLFIHTHHTIDKSIENYLSNINCG